MTMARISGGGGFCCVALSPSPSFGNSLEVVDEGLNGPDRWVRAVPVNQFPGEVLRDACLFCNLLPLGWAGLTEPMDKGVEDCAHAPLFPVCGKLSTHRREADAGTSPPTGLQMERLMVGPSKYGVAAMTARETLAQNFRALMDGHPSPRRAFFMEPEQIANLVCFLLDDRSSAVHGAVIPADEGLTATM